MKNPCRTKPAYRRRSRDVVGGPELDGRLDRSWTRFAHGGHRPFRLRAIGEILLFNSRSVEPTHCNCSRAHSRRIPPKLPSDRFSLAATFASSSLRSGWILIVTVVFHTPIDEVCVYNRKKLTAIETTEVSVWIDSRSCRPRRFFLPVKSRESFASKTVL